MNIRKGQKTRWGSARRLALQANRAGLVKISSVYVDPLKFVEYLDHEQEERTNNKILRGPV